VKKSIRYLGLDVHAKTIACAVAEPTGEVLDLGVIPNTEDALARMLKRLKKRGSEVQVCYEAGPTGYAVYWQLAKREVQCDVVAPSLIPKIPGDRVKTDRRDAAKLARLYRSGDLTPVWVPDREHEALRDLVRAREVAVTDQTRARHRLTKLLLRYGLREPPKMTRWTKKHRAWLSSHRFEQNATEHTFADYLQEVEHAAERILRLEKVLKKVVEECPQWMQEIVLGLQALHGVGPISSMTFVAEIGSFTRFSHPSQLMGYSGMVPKEHSSGQKVRRGGITKTGNAHLRRVLVEAAWVSRRKPGGRPPLRARNKDIDPRVIEIANKAQQRLHNRHWHLLNRGKNSKTAVVAVARELLGFVWDIGVYLERKHQST